MASFSPPRVFNLFPSVPDGSTTELLSGESKAYFFRDKNLRLCRDTTITEHIRRDLDDCKLEFVYFYEETGSVTITFNENKGQWGCPRIRETIVYDGPSRLHRHHGGTKREGMKRLVAFLMGGDESLSSGWKISFPDSIARDLGDALIANKNLKTLHLPDCGESPEKRSVVERILSESPSLEELHLKTHWFPGKRECGSELVSSLANGLRNNRSNLRTLDLQGCNLSDAGGAQIVRGLLANHRPGSTLQHLDLMFNNCSEKTVAEIGEMLRVPRCSLRTLNLSNQQRGRSSGVLDVTSLALSLSINTSLKDLDISKNKITSSSLVSLSKAILYNNESCIENLSMGSLSVVEESNNNAGEPYYSSSIHHHHRNDGGGGGERCSFSVGMAVALRGGITTANNKALKSLDLSGNAMDPDALSALADVLATRGCPIEHLNLDSCGITEEGMRSFTVPRLPRMEGLKTLGLNLNPLMGARGVEILLEDGLRHNTSLVSVGVCDRVKGGGGCCLPPKACYGCSCSVERFLPEIRFWLALNKAGARKLLREPNTAPLGLKAPVLERALRDKEMGVGIVYYCLSQGFLT